MARLLSNNPQINTLTRTLTRPKFAPPLPLTLRHRSNGSGDGEGEPTHPQLIEIDLDSSNGSDGGIIKLDEMIHSFIAIRSAPDWLPFMPGYSYWVPPYVKVGGGVAGGIHSHSHSHRGGVSDFDPHRIVEVVEKMAAVKTHFGSASSISSSFMLLEDETTSVTRVRSWPSSSFFTGGSVPTFPTPAQVVEVELKLEDNSDYDSKSEDEG